MDSNFWKVDVDGGGFLPREQASETVSFELLQHNSVIKNIIQLAEEGKLRETISNLPYVELILSEEELIKVQENYDIRWIRLAEGVEQETAFAIFSMLASAYVHALTAVGRKEPDNLPLVLPPCIAVPLKRLASQVKRLPIVDYATIVLANWKILDGNRSISLDNIEILRTFSGTTSEQWFYKIHIVIEAYGGQAIQAILEAIDCIHESEKRQLKRQTAEELLPLAEKVNHNLKRLAAAIRMMNETLGQMTKGCRADEFYDIIRPWLGGWPKGGVIYAEDFGTYPEPLELGGGSGAQSSLLPCIDAFLGVKYGINESDVKCSGMKKFVEQLAKYRLHMPLQHLQTIESLESGRSVRSFISRCNAIIGRFYPAKFDENIEKYDYDESSISLNPQENQVGSYEAVPLLTRERHRIQALKLSDEIFESRQMYNECVESLLAFRRKHVGYATMYITRRAKLIAENVTDEKEKEVLMLKAAVGTGGSTFAKHLINHINDTRQCLYKLRLPPPVVVDVEEELGIGNRDRDWTGLLSTNYTADNTHSWYAYGIFEKLKDQVDKLASYFITQGET